MNLTLRVTGPTFVVGVCYLGDDTTVAYRVAPLVGYMRGWPADRVRSYAARRGWAVEVFTVGGQMELLP